MPITGLGPPISEDEKIKVGEGMLLTDDEKLSPKVVNVIDVTPTGIVVAPVTRQPYGTRRRIWGSQASIYLVGPDDKAVIDLTRMKEVPRTKLFRLPEGKQTYRVRHGMAKELRKLVRAQSDPGHEDPPLSSSSAVGDTGPEPRRKSFDSNDVGT